MKINTEVLEKIKNQLTSKNATKICSRCNTNNFTVIEHFINFPLSQEISSNVIIGGPSLPCAATICNNCGHLDFHALGALGLLNK